MPPLASWPRTLLTALAALFAAATTLYSVVWMWSAPRTPTAYLGIEFDFLDASASARIFKVAEGSPAARAGLRPGDRIVAVDGRPLRDLIPMHDAVVYDRPGTPVRLTVQRPPQAAPLTIEVTLAPPPAPSAPDPWSRRLADGVLNAYPVLFLVVSVALLLLRPEDRNAWLLALVFAGFIAGAPLLEPKLPAAFRGFSIAYKIGFGGALAGFFYYFFSVFPAPSPLDRRLPWLKTLWLAGGLTVSVPLALWGLVEGSSHPLIGFAREVPVPLRFWLMVVYGFGGIGLGFVSLIWNALRGPAEARRKGRVIVWGTLLGFGPFVLLTAFSTYLRRSFYDSPFWIWASCVVALFLIPLSFTYAVVKHRVLEVPVLLRRSARYLLVQRGSVGLLLLMGVAAALAFSLSFGRRLGPGTETAAMGLGVGFGTVLVWTGSQVQRRLRERIDRAFFRSAYDARQILQDLAEKARFATSRDDLAALLEHHVRSALLPRTLAVYFESREQELTLVCGSAPAGRETLPATLPVLVALAQQGQPREWPEPGSGEPALAALEPECLVPILGRGSRLTGLLVLGPRLSEEPYSGEDRRLLASVASQAGIALESIRLAEQIAERLEAERLAGHEMELAKQVQSKLLPQSAPVLATLECGGCCVQARAVGGDYYDFLDLGPGRLGLALADISGKGFPAALLMANLQASLRSRSAQDMLDLPRQLRSVNHLLYRSSEANRYATLFLGVYDDSCRRLSYANCGHNPPLLVRQSGRVERLDPTAPVLGLFEEWECATGEVGLEPGDLIVVFSDGISEAFSDQGEEFGEERLIELLRAHRDLPVLSLIDVVIRNVREFSGSEQEDDQTLLVARAR